MQIKNKITPQLKKAMSESIKKTMDSAREHGFYICADKEGNLTPSRIRCRGSECGMIIENFPGTCPEKMQGLFHTHPQRSLVEKRINRKITDEEIKSYIEGRKKIAEKTGITIQSPSHRDLLTVFISKCRKLTEGTSCVAGDIEPDKVECWTPKRGVTNFVTCGYAEYDNVSTKKGDIEPKAWIRPLFNKEVINLKEDP